MPDLMIIATANLLIGALIGICGVAGFLLPMLYTGFFLFPVPKALALSFLAFIVSGALGSRNYYKKGSLNVRFALILSLGSLLGGLVGVRLNALIAPTQAKVLLYVVVLLSGLSIIFRKDPAPGREAVKNKHNLLDSKLFTVLFGFVTGTICSLSGAGGPVLVMPLLVSLGMDIRFAVGVALFNSVFIGIPAGIGYFSQSGLSGMLPLVLASSIPHGIGVLLGSSQAHRVKQKPLKLGVACFSILLSLYMIVTL